jgi:chitin disaccharide deacetylase
MPEGVWELVCHPGYNDSDLDAITTRLRATREIEYAALLSAFDSLHPSRPELIHYGEITSERAE